MEKVVTGNYAAAYGAKLCRPQVIPAYPITPQTTVVEKMAEFCASGGLDARLVEVESELSAMAFCIGASISGARTFTATSSHGLALMHEMLHWAAGGRLPIVMVNANRALGAPWCLGTDQGDSLAQRDTGWIQFYCESGQEVLDRVIQAFRIAEEVLLPAMVVYDGFYLSHTYERVDIPAQELVDEYLPHRTPSHPLNPGNPVAYFGGSQPADFYKFRRSIQAGMEEAAVLTNRIEKEFAEKFGRRSRAVEGFALDDAELVLVTSSTTATTARETVRKLRQQGKRVGMVKIGLFRPFPFQEIREALAGSAKVGVIDRNISLGMGGIFCQEVKSALCGRKGGDKPVFGFVAGLGGVDITPATIEDIVDYCFEHTEPSGDVIWTGSGQ